MKEAVSIDAEMPTIDVAQFLQEEYPNIVHASNIGMHVREFTEDEGCIGLLDANSVTQPTRWQRFWGRRPRRRFMGILWIFNGVRKAKRGNWVLEVYGEDIIDFLKPVAERLSDEFDTSIEIRLLNKKPRYERFSSD